MDVLTIQAGIGAGLLTRGSGARCKAHGQPALAFIGPEPICQACAEEGIVFDLPGWRDVRIDAGMGRKLEGAPLKTRL